MAGICIGIAGFVFLALSTVPGVFAKVSGSVLFAFGLLAVVNFKYKLYTGTIGFVNGPKESGEAFIILGGNIVGCLMVALLARVSPMPLQDAATGILKSRLATGPVACGLLAIGCGLIMTAAVKFARKGRFLPLVFGVPAFIICGFPHCVADAFYYLTAPLAETAAHPGQFLLTYVLCVAGNLVGCNLYRWIVPEDGKES